MFAPADHHLLNSKQLAAAMGLRSTWVIKGAKLAAEHCGDSPWRGRYCSLENFKKWMDAHPEFVASHWVRKRPARHAEPASDRKMAFLARRLRPERLADIR